MHITRRMSSARKKRLLNNIVIVNGLILTDLNYIQISKPAKFLWFKTTDYISIGRIESINTIIIWDEEYLDKIKSIAKEMEDVFHIEVEIEIIDL
jgi:hypothetical protein